MPIVLDLTITNATEADENLLKSITASYYSGEPIAIRQEFRVDSIAQTHDQNPDGVRPNNTTQVKLVAVYRTEED